MYIHAYELIYTFCSIMHMLIFSHIVFMTLVVLFNMFCTNIISNRDMR